SWLVVEAGDLNPSSALRKAFERSAHAAAVQNYPLEGADLQSLIRSLAAEAEIQVEPAALELLCRHLGVDRMAVRGELQKLFLYAGASGIATADDVEAIVGDTVGVRSDQVVDAALLGDHEAVEAGLESLRSEGSSAAALAAQALRHLLLLSALQAEI